VLVTQRPVFFQSLVDDVFEFERQIRIEPNWWSGGTIQNCFEDDRRTLATEGQLASGHLIEDGSKREQIGPCIQFSRPRLLRRHISDGAERRTRAGEVLFVNRSRHGIRRCNLIRRTDSGRNLCQPKIQNLGVTACGNEDVRRLDVAMNDTFGVGGVERVSDVNRQTEQNIGVEGLSGDAIFQCHPVQKLHND